MRNELTHVYLFTRSPLLTAVIKKALKPIPYRLHLLGAPEELEAIPSRAIFILDREHGPALSRRALAVLVAKWPICPKLLVGDVSISEMCELLALGLHGFISPERLERKLSGALNLLSQGHYYVPQAALEQYVAFSRLRKAPGAERRDPTPRQREIVRLLNEGSTNRQISLALSISENTVRFHIAKLFSRTGVHDRNFIPKLLSEK